MERLSITLTTSEVQALLIALADSSTFYHTDREVRAALQAFAARIDEAVKMQMPELKEFAQLQMKILVLNGGREDF